MPGKAKGKGKEKKLARKAEAERAAATKAAVQALCQGSASGAALAAQYPAFLRYDRHGVRATLRFYGAGELPAELLGWALGLTRRHMAALYDACPGWGWSEAKKRAELADLQARFVVVFREGEQEAQPAQQAHQAQQAQQLDAVQPPAAAAGQENQAAAGNGAGRGGDGCGAGLAAAAEPVAFLHFRFEEEEGEAVLYCYEVQAAAEVQGKGLGRHLMQLLELLGRRAGVARLMLTVFHENEAAVQLYRKLGYVLDVDSPGAVDPAGSHKYEIMTKWLRQPARASAGG